MIAAARLALECLRDAAQSERVALIPYYGDRLMATQLVDICDAALCDPRLAACDRAEALHGERDPDEAAREAGQEMLREQVAARGDAVYVVFDGPPSHESGRFVEVETEDGHGRGVGEWEEHPTAPGLWRLGPLYAAPPAAATQEPDAVLTLVAIRDVPGEFAMLAIQDQPKAKRLLAGRDRVELEVRVRREKPC